MRTIAVATFLALPMPAMSAAEDRVVSVDCLCVAEEQGWVRGRGMQTSGEAGLDEIETGTPESTLVLSAKSDQCAKFASGCGDERMAPVTGERRMRLDSLSYMLIDDDFRLNLDGVAAPPDR